MKKTSKLVRYNYPVLRLHYTDLIEIYNLIKKQYNEVGVTVDEYEIQSIEEIEELNKDLINTVYINTKSLSYSKIRIVIADSYAYLESLQDEDDYVLVGICLQIDKILRSKKSRLRTFFTSMWWYIPQILITTFLAYWFLDWLGIIVIGIFNTLSPFFYNRFVKRNVVYLKNTPSFFKRNKDSIVLLLIGAVVGTFCTFCFNLLKDIVVLKK